MEEALAAYFARQMPGATAIKISALFRIPGGASRETWMFDAAWQESGQSCSGAFVVRRDPPASLLETDREVEYTYYSAFAGSPVPVPRMRWLEPDASYLGAPFFIMERVLGCDVSPQTIQAPNYDASRPVIARRMYEILAELHRFDWTRTGIARLGTPPTPATCWQRELDHWEGVINANEISPQPIIRAAIRWCRANPPPPARAVTVVHGDYRVGNFLYRPAGTIHAVLDWEMAHLGDPLEDVAWSFMELWEWARDGRKGGIVAADAAIAAYEAAAGAKIDREALHWWDVFSSVKAQGIWLTGARSFQEGRTSELMMGVTSYALINQQDEIALRAMGRGA